MNHVVKKFSVGFLVAIIAFGFLLVCILKNESEKNKISEKIAGGLSNFLNMTRVKSPYISEKVTENAKITQFSEDKISYFREDKPLEGEERTKFLQEVNYVFSELIPGAIDSEAVMPQVIAINERYRRGLRTILDIISIPPQSNDEVRPRIAYIDYLNYRMQWDGRSRQDIVKILISTDSKEANIEFRSAFVGDKIDLMKGLGKHDWNLALSCLAEIKDPWLAKKLATAALSGRRNHPNYNLVEDKSSIVSVVPSFGI